MAKERFGKSRGPTREEIEREAKREVERLTRRSGAPSGGGGGFGAVASTPLDSVAQNLGGATMRRRPRDEPEPPSFGGAPQQGYGGPIGVAGGRGRGAPSPYDEDEDDDGDYDEEGFDEDDEEIAITEMALRDYATQMGGRPEDHIVIPVDPASAEAMRDRAMQEFMERQAARRPPSEAGASTKPADGGVLGRLQAKRAEKEARAAQGLPETEGPDEDDEGGDEDREAGVLARIAARRRGEDDQPRQAFTPPAREERRAAPAFEGPVPEFVNVAARMSRNRPTPSGRPAPAKAAPAVKRSPSAKKAAAKKAPAKRAAAKKAPAKKAPAKKAPPRKAPTRKAPAKKAPAKKAPAKKAPAKKAAKRRA